ncbi:ATP-binding cassette domain-containing protein [Mycoplasma testudineum]|uniref:ATP-binding cassette domain-containing protein n=1 Tax=Mycoplasma testudineum TaxID=244584 RepID=UPI001414E6D7|nr:ATP-binding cassette domain-containing protein [Mycoplasma testudineum]
MNFVIKPGEQLGIFSLERNGKSSFLKIFLKLMHPISGDLFINDKSLYSMNKNEIRNYLNNIYYLTSTPIAMPNKSVFENIYQLMPREKNWKQFFGFVNENEFKKVNKIIDELGLSEYAFKKEQSLNGTQKMYVELAKIFASKDPIVIADDPTSLMDSIYSDNYLNFLTRHCRETKKTLILVSHDEYLVKRHFKKVLTIENQRIREVSRKY